MPPVARITRCVLTVVAYLCVSSGCGSLPPERDAGAEPLRLAAASDLQEALPRIVERFRATHPGEIEVSFGASGQLAQQIRAGAPLDLFLSANLGFVGDLAEQGIIDAASVRPYAVGSLVIVQPESSPIAVTSITDLTRADLRHVAIANPELAPYGIAARQALQAAGIWDGAQPRIVMADTVRQALQFVQSGNADAGIVGRAISRVGGLKGVAVDSSLHAPIVQGLGVVAASSQRDRARAFASYLLGAEAQGILTEYGFMSPPGQQQQGRP
jgi:molybdate transport system substrate-binding protein